jgi:hypothetical protein
MKLSELEKELEKLDFEAPLIINGAESVKDTKKFIRSHLGYLKANKGNKGYLPYFKRLFKFYQTATNENSKRKL